MASRASTLLAVLSSLFAPVALAAEDPAPKWRVDDPHGPGRDARISVSEGTWMNVDVHGDRVIFDLLGDLWTVPLAGGEARRLTSGAAWDTNARWSPDGSRIVWATDRGGNEQLWIMNADGSGARALTDEKDARVVDPVWDPSGAWIVARRRTVDTRSIGVTELWQFHVDGGKGFRLTTLDAHPHAAEATMHGEWLWFSSRAGRFEYGGNPVGGLWTIWRLNRRTGQLLPQVSGAGGAARPLVSRDGRTLVFISRDRNKTLLERMDLATGKRAVIADWLDRDEMEAFALHGTYPSMSWTPAGEVALWAKGRLWRVKLDGTRVEIPFVASGEWRFREVPRWPRPIVDEVRAKVLRWPTWRADGTVAFSALGQLWTRGPDGALARLSPADVTGYAPAWSPDGARLAWTSWDDAAGGALHVTTWAKNGKSSDEVLPIAGQLVNPSWSADGNALVALRGVGGQTSPDLGAEPWFEVVYLRRAAKGGWTSKVVTAVDNRGSSSRATRVWLRDERVWFVEDRAAAPRTPAEQVIVSVALDGTDRRAHLVLPGAQETAISPDFTRVAYRHRDGLFVTALPLWSAEIKTADGAFPVVKVAEASGDWVAWAPAGDALTWAEGPVLVRRPIAGLGVERGEDGTPKEDPAKRPEANVRTEVELRVPRARPTGTLAITGARVLTMRAARPDEVVENATIVIDRDRIASIVPGGAPPAGATVIDAKGKTVIPGLIDVHAHLHYTAGDVLPEQEWRYLTNLDFGVTTVHDPSAATDLVFTQAERVEAGLERGPRVYSTGGVLYGALSIASADTPTPDAANGHVRRLAAVGATSVKVYQQSQRERRQWYVEACNAQKILCVPEGGGDLYMNLGMVADGFHAIEHSVPNAPLYEDVRRWWAAQPGTFYTPTLLVGYGGAVAEDWFHQHASPLDDARLLRHYPRRELDALAWRRDALHWDTEWNWMTIARDAAKLQAAGVPVTLGAHGQLQGLGVHWELWALGTTGAMRPLDALRAATLDGARYIGVDADLGSLEAGKLADLVILDADPRDDLRNTTRIDRVIKNGEVVSAPEAPTPPVK